MLKRVCRKSIYQRVIQVKAVTKLIFTLHLPLVASIAIAQQQHIPPSGNVYSGPMAATEATGGLPPRGQGLPGVFLAVSNPGNDLCDMAMMSPDGEIITCTGDYRLGRLKVGEQRPFFQECSCYVEYEGKQCSLTFEYQQTMRITGATKAERENYSPGTRLVVFCFGDYPNFTVGTKSITYTPVTWEAPGRGPFVGY